ncbi:MAG TPA: cytidylate kinase-like family protein [Thermodesulfobacteriota bacterium]|nr:cytidylate kinase-like family protein [Deltaproteobacteria bacterium]HNR11683.1 cytidylate kinase-like family protein [Thermodesulfobacteriota bacterium]HNU71619.1 cytidylate kinase-like family protein [Thermodesulfobacteriota bacterium]HOC38943.1 cytidylate kinase-like family protein [Thermodesulfobacteriota bacterium]HQO77509.1 cytidylate kinase-like family protein [Thermodesulfobacteriota bacterium]
MKPPRIRSVEQIIEDQAARWRAARETKQERELPVSVFTFSRDPGSHCYSIAEKLAQDLDFTFYADQIVHAVAESASVRDTLVGTLDEKGRSALNDMIAAVESKRHLWSYDYLNHLIRVIGAIGRLGRAVILGRGAHFILPRKGLFRVRVFAPMDAKVHKISTTREMSQEEARRFVIKTESERKAFIRKYFNADNDDPKNYDLLINTEIISVEAAVECIKAASGMSNRR